MAAEYPDTTWSGPPRAYGKGRDGKAVRLSVVHYTAGSESRSSAENGAAYDRTRTDGTSCHVFHDPDSSVQEVLRQDRANSAFSKGNRLGVHHEYCGTAQTRAQWLDEASDAILWRAARAHAKDCLDFGLEPRRLSPAEVRRAWYEFPNGPRGLCGHDDITRAFPEDGGDHLDPGAGFPWDILIARVRFYLGSPQEDDMADFTPNDVNAWTQAVRVEEILGKVRQVTVDVAEIKARPAGTVVLTPEAEARLLAGFGAAAEAAVRRVLGAVDGATPPV